MKKTKQMVALALSLFLLVGNTTGVWAKDGQWYDTEQEYHADVDYEDMVYEGIDLDALGILTKTLLDDAAVPDNYNAVVQDMEDVLDYIDYIGTQYALINLKHDADPSDEEVADQYQESVSLINDAYDMASIAIRQALNSPNAELVGACLGDGDLVEDFSDYEDLTDRERELSDEITALVDDYDNAYLEEYDSDEARNQVLGEIYVQLVKLRNEEAQIAGYDNYAEYAYAEIYNRDYTTEEIKQVYADVQEYILPLISELIPYYYSSGALDDLSPSEEETIEMVRPYLEEIDPELTTAFDYMVDHHLYDLGDSDTKMDVGYTTTFTSDGSAFIFNNPEDGWYRVETLVHEYGHYNTIFHNMEHDMLAVTNMDVSEINSQGLEVLFLDYADEMYGKEGATEVKMTTLINLLGVISEACMYDEFQIAAYTYEGELDVDTLNEMFLDISANYSYEEDVEIYSAYDWVEIPHTFESPMYYISYGTSALATLEILALEQEDRQSAIDCYMEMTTYGTSLPYRELLTTCGLQDIFEEGAIENIADGITPAVDELIDAQMQNLNSGMSVIVWIVAGISMVFVALAVIIGVTAWKKQKKRVEE